jgi:hypothetical protein
MEQDLITAAADGPHADLMAYFHPTGVPRAAGYR